MQKHSIRVEHNIEVAHRLTKVPGKCENIHGHSMWVEFEMWGWLTDAGILAGVTYGDLKSSFRHHLDSEFDHHCLLNHEDPLVKDCEDAGIKIPGATLCREDPTTENIAKWIGGWGQLFIVGSLKGPITRLKVTVHETRVNVATWEWEE